MYWNRKGVFLYPASCFHDESAQVFVLGSDRLYTKFWMCYIYFKKMCCFSNSMTSEDPKNWIYNHSEYLPPHYDTIFNETAGHLGWISCEISYFPARYTCRPVRDEKPWEGVHRSTCICSLEMKILIGDV